MLTGAHFLEAHSGVIAAAPVQQELHLACLRSDHDLGEHGAHKPSAARISTSRSRIRSTFG
jgi:hypothetical protein